MPALALPEPGETLPWEGVVVVHMAQRVFQRYLSEMVQEK